MKTAVIFCDGIKQVVFTPETEDEKYALSLLTPDDDIELLITNGGFGDSHRQPFTANVGECRGGYLRLFQDTDSRILVLKPKSDGLTCPDCGGRIGQVQVETGPDQILCRCKLR